MIYGRTVHAQVGHSSLALEPAGGNSLYTEHKQNTMALARAAAASEPRSRLGTAAPAAASVHAQDDGESGNRRVDRCRLP